MFSTFRDLVEEIRSLNHHLQAVRHEWSQLPSLKDRVESLELARAQFEADMEGIFLKADGKLKAAASAEARERTMKKQYEHLLDPFDPVGEQERTPGLDRLLDRDAPAGEEERVQPVHVDVAPNDKTQALRAKFAHPFNLGS